MTYDYNLQERPLYEREEERERKEQAAIERWEAKKQDGYAGELCLTPAECHYPNCMCSIKK